MNDLPQVARILVFLIIVLGLTVLWVGVANWQYKQGNEWVLGMLAFWGAFDIISSVFKWLMKGIE